VQVHPQNVWFVENLGKIPENTGKIPENLAKVAANVLLFGKNGVFLEVRQKRSWWENIRTKIGTNFYGTFRKFGQKSFATPQICLLLLIWLQSHRPQKLEVKIISLASVYCHAYGFGLLLYGWRFVQYGVRNCESTLMQLWKCFIVSQLRSACLAIHQTEMKTKCHQLQRAYKTSWLSRKATARARSEILALGPQWSNFETCPIVNETAYFVSCTSAISLDNLAVQNLYNLCVQFRRKKAVFLRRVRLHCKSVNDTIVRFRTSTTITIFEYWLTKYHTRMQYKQIKIQLDV